MDNAGRINHTASWGSVGEEFWEFWLKATVVRLRRYAYEVRFNEEESALRGKLLRALPSTLQAQVEQAPPSIPYKLAGGF